MEWTLIDFVGVLGLLPLGFLSLAYWAGAIQFLIAAHRSSPRLVDGLQAFDAAGEGGGTSGEGRRSAGRVSIIMPAHDEQGVIDEAIGAIRATTYPDWRLIVVADRCTDRTVEIARRHAKEDSRVSLIENAACPPEWSGKCHASWLGAKAADGEWLLFADADTLFAATLVAAAVGTAVNNRLDFLSLLGRLRARHGFEKTAQPVAAIAIMSMYPVHLSNRNPPARGRRPFANGQFMLFRRRAYEAAGTHEVIRDSILEDIRMARRLDRQGCRMAITPSGPLFMVRMYETIEDFRRGWMRIFTEAANRNVPRLRRSARRLRLLATSPAIHLAVLATAGWEWGRHPAAAIALGCVGAMAVVTQLTALGTIYRLQGAPVSAIWRFPMGCLEVASILSAAANNLVGEGRIEWARLKYAVEERHEK